MPTQVPLGPEKAITPQEHPQVTADDSPHPPGRNAPAWERHPQQSIATLCGDYPAVTYPQEGAAGYPMPVPYPQPSIGPPAAAPPWDAAATPGADTAPPEQPLPEYGGLLVPFPDEMRHASRAQPPAVWPVAMFALLFGVLGAISAKRRADHARRTHNSTVPYWVAFLVSVAAGAFCWFVVAAVVIGPALTEIRESSRLEAVQRNVVGDGQFKDARITVTAARCRAVADRDAAGMRDYLCRLTLHDGHTGVLVLTADESGRWHAG